MIVVERIGEPNREEHRAWSVRLIGVPIPGEYIAVAKKQSKKGDDKSNSSFEGSLGKLEEIVRQLEDGQLPLGQALDQYEQGVRHLKTCYELLERAERRIELLRGIDADGNPITEPFDEQATESLEDTRTARSRKRSTREVSSGDVNMDLPGTLF